MYFSYIALKFVLLFPLTFLLSQYGTSEFFNFISKYQPMLTHSHCNEEKVFFQKKKPLVLKCLNPHYAHMHARTQEVVRKRAKNYQSFYKELAQNSSHNITYIIVSINNYRRFLMVNRKSQKHKQNSNTVFASHNIQYSFWLCVLFQMTWSVFVTMQFVKKNSS